MTVALDPLFRDLNRLATEMFGTSRAPRPMAMDAYRAGDKYVVEFDLPGVDRDSLEVNAEGNTLTVRAERPERPTKAGGEQYSFITTERPRGSFSRQLTLGNGLDLDNITAEYADGVLMVTLPIAEQSRPRRIEVAHGEKEVIEGTTD